MMSIETLDLLFETDLYRFFSGGVALHRFRKTPLQWSILNEEVVYVVRLDERVGEYVTASQPVQRAYESYLASLVMKEDDSLIES